MKSNIIIDYVTFLRKSRYSMYTENAHTYILHNNKCRMAFQTQYLAQSLLFIICCTEILLELIRIIKFCSFWLDHWQPSSNTLFNGQCREKQGVLNGLNLPQVWTDSSKQSCQPNPQRISEEILILLCWPYSLSLGYLRAFCALMVI